MPAIRHVQPPRRPDVWVAPPSRTVSPRSRSATASRSSVRTAQPKGDPCGEPPSTQRPNALMRRPRPRRRRSRARGRSAPSEHDPVRPCPSPGGGRPALDASPKPVQVGAPRSVRDRAPRHGSLGGGEVAPTAAAHPRPSAIAVTIRDWPRRASPAANTPSTGRVAGGGDRPRSPRSTPSASGERRARRR